MVSRIETKVGIRAKRYSTIKGKSPDNLPAPQDLIRDRMGIREEALALPEGQLVTKRRPHHVPNVRAPVTPQASNVVKRHIVNADDLAIVNKMAPSICQLTTVRLKVE